MSAEKDFTSISPSATTLLLTKGYTNIPFARQAAEVVYTQGNYRPDFSITDVKFWSRVLHFESRYWSIDQLLADTDIQNFIELSSGFSFRGLAMTNRSLVNYIDTDLPDVIDTKKNLLHKLAATQSENLLTEPLNVLDEKSFRSLVNRFGKGQIGILNEGLLMYLNAAEKAELLQIIQKILKERGGFWITADIYVRNKMEDQSSALGLARDFFRQHNIEENKFESFDAAKDFFEKAGFRIDKIAGPEPSKLTALPHLLKNLSENERERFSGRKKIRETWRLTV